MLTIPSKLQTKVQSHKGRYFYKNYIKLIYTFDCSSKRRAQVKDVLGNETVKENFVKMFAFHL